jgi:hypothetical protein
LDTFLATIRASIVKAVEVTTLGENPRAIHEGP